MTVPAHHTGGFAGVAVAAGWRAVCRLWAWRWAGGIGPASRTSSEDFGRQPGRAVSGYRRPRPVAAIRCRKARASLRGAASHKAKGRGGADRMGLPMGRCRLRLLREIGDELVPVVARRVVQLSR